MASESSPPTSLPTIEVIHMMPCKIDYVGPAPVSEYFNATRVVNEKDKTETASFRGRPLNGAEIPFRQNGYRLYKAVMEKTIDDGDTEDNSEPEFRLTHEIGSLMYWNLDKATSSDDSLQKLMRYLIGAKAFAQSSVNEKMEEKSECDSAYGSMDK